MYVVGDWIEGNVGNLSFGDCQDIFSPSNCCTTRKGRNDEPFDASINGFTDANEHSMSFFSGVSGAETVSAEVAFVDPCERVNFASNSVFGKNPKFVDLGISPAHTADKLKSVIVLATIVGGLTDNSDGLASWHHIVKVTADRASEAKAYSDYIKNSEFESMKALEFENNFGTRLNQMT